MIEEGLKNSFKYAICQNKGKIEITPMTDDNTIHINGRAELDYFINQVLDRSRWWKLFLFFRILAIVLTYGFVCIFLRDKGIRALKVFYKRKK